MWLLNQVGRLWGQSDKNSLQKQYEQDLQNILEYREDLELLSSWKKWYWAKLNLFITEWIITKEELKDLKFLWLTERKIVTDIDSYKILLNIVKWDIVSILEMEWLINISNEDISKIKWYLRQIIDLDRILSKNNKIIIEEFLRWNFN